MGDHQQEQLSHEDVIKIQKLVIEDMIALKCWSLVVDYLLKSPPDVLKVRNILREQDYRKAVLETLSIWNDPANSEGRPDLVKVLRDLRLQSLADKIFKLGLFPAITITDTTPESE